MVGEGGGVDGEPGGVVPPGDEGTDGHSLRQHRLGEVDVGQRPSHLPKFAEEGESEDLGEVPGGGVTAVGPHPQPFPGGG